MKKELDLLFEIREYMKFLSYDETQLILQKAYNVEKRKNKIVIKFKDKINFYIHNNGNKFWCQNNVLCQINDKRVIELIEDDDWLFRERFLKE